MNHFIIFFIFTILFFVETASKIIMGGMDGFRITDSTTTTLSS
ncbi:uncharacterized protein CELE_C32E8.12 [Caenorhabditis elegans]|uniref:Uncharacterized protein n=1 Tax=Caenorhabditis elegans TaxID=6239 RepID=C7FZT4_CAEEL|nr:Uncharacterized protein CELE_C32E8.12 [Caenorhabditis elegans]CCD66416.1 Uncharacterized protein CELE_C32E8.12 [Caenorhabditis elegans]|eukprot:NP_001249436.1 Uncharacterized protein CELE_C32E8.12 [Caenorhabditis elegans]